MIRTYSELVKLPTFRERFEYLKLDGTIGVETCGLDRYLNQRFYTSAEWKHVRDIVIVRDNGCDLGLDGYGIYGRIYIHHMNPIMIADLVEKTEFLSNPEYLICTSRDTHYAIHYGAFESVQKDPIIRRPNDTCPWRE